MRHPPILCINPATINGVEIRFDGELVNLTNLHKAAGGANHKKPSLWLLKESTQDFIAALNGRKSDLLKITKGRYGGTFGHWQIALAYAKYLSPEFHIAANKIIKRYIEEEIDPFKDFGWSTTLWHERLRLVQCQQQRL